MWATLPCQLSPLLPVNVVNGPLIRPTVTDTLNSLTIHKRVFIFNPTLHREKRLLHRIVCFHSFLICVPSFFESHRSLMISIVALCVFTVFPFLIVRPTHGKHSGDTPPSWQVASQLQTEVTGKPGVTLPAMALPPVSAQWTGRSETTAQCGLPLSPFCLDRSRQIEINFQSNCSPGLIFKQVIRARGSLQLSSQREDSAD